ncbi:MAG: DNA gyrase subunit A, partial [Gammaproteobacteria bacterium]|nr:DNA gyrase subunit A [Gammaproteobacteria bacterium]
IALIKAAKNPAEAKEKLISTLWQPGIVIKMLERTGAESSRPDGLAITCGLVEGSYRLSETQAQAILDMRLHRLTGLEQDKIITEFEELLKIIAELLEILGSADRLMEVIIEELNEIKDQYGDERRTEIISNQEDLTIEDLITEEDVVVTLSHEGYAKSQPITVYSAQRRGGKGKAATSVKDEDFVDKLFVASTHDTILCFSSKGKVYWLKVFEVPQAGRTARGRPIINLLPLETGERINAILPIREYEEDKFIFFATANGTVKKTPLKEFSRPRASGIIAVDLRDGDKLIGVELTDGKQDVLLSSSSGKAICFNEDDVRAMGRSAVGVRGIKLKDDQHVISLIIAKGGYVLTATENGYGKRTAMDDYPRHGRGGQGVISVQTSDRNGDVTGAKLVQDDDEMMLITSGGTLVRTRVDEVSVMGRNTQGVRLIRLGEDEQLTGIECIANIQTDTELVLDDSGTEETVQHSDAKSPESEE